MEVLQRFGKPDTYIYSSSWSHNYITQLLIEIKGTPLTSLHLCHLPNISIPLICGSCLATLISVIDLSDFIYTDKETLCHHKMFPYTIIPPQQPLIAPNNTIEASKQTEIIVVPVCTFLRAFTANLQEVHTNLSDLLLRIWILYVYCIYICA